ncbi:MAG: alpha/beta hydrolase [Longimicrobiales bacterium]|nr:alpha/beta hydrolase [Longimicrobiales bacterium]
MDSAPLHHTLARAPGAEPTRWLLVLHGIYGSGRNWNSVLRRVVERRPEWGAVLTDLRGHGDSPPLAPPHTLDACVGDLGVLSAHLPGRPTVLVGHSFGGKVALLYGDEPGHAVEQVWIIDSTPDARPPAGSAWEMLRLLRRVGGPFPTRQDGVEALEARGVARPVAQWMATNLIPEGDRYRWRLDPDQMEALLLDFFRTDAWGAVEHPHGPALHFVRARNSSVLDDEARARVRAAGTATGRATLHEVEGGHWLNADNPDAVVELLVQGLPRD